MSEVSGKMTDSWTPSPSIRKQAISSFPHVTVDSVTYQFRDYYQDPTHNQVRTRGEWDRKFLSWCSRREERWIDDHRDQTVEYDDVTGMPKHPKPIQYAPRKEEES